MSPQFRDTGGHALGTGRNGPSEPGLLPALEAGIDVKVVSAQLGHSTTQITSDIYQHVRRVKADEAAERVAALLPRRQA